MTKQINRSFDKTVVYESELKPFLERLRAICREHDIPMLAVVAYKCEDDDDETDIHYALGGCAGKGAWMPDEMLMAASILGGEVKKIAVPQYSKARTETGKHGKN